MSSSSSISTAMAIIPPHSPSFTTASTIPITSSPRVLSPESAILIAMMARPSTAIRIPRLALPPSPSLSLPATSKGWTTKKDKEKKDKQKKQDKKKEKVYTDEQKKAFNRKKNDNKRKKAKEALLKQKMAADILVQHKTLDNIKDQIRQIKKVTKMMEKKLETIQTQTKKKTPKKRVPKSQEEGTKNKKSEKIDPSMLEKITLLWK